MITGVVIVLSGLAIFVGVTVAISLRWPRDPGEGIGRPVLEALEEGA